MNEQEFNFDVSQNAGQTGISRRISRRNFLGLAAFVVGGTVLPVPFLEEGRTWDKANTDNQTFFNEHKEVLQRSSIGCSFSPEWLGDGLFVHDKDLRKDNLSMLDEIERWGIKQVRLGIRWSQAVNEKGEIDLSFYRPYFEKCLRSNFDICLNFGPIKTFRWPEEHIPEYFLKENPGITDLNSVVSSETELAHVAINYLAELIPALKSEFGPELSSRVKIVQPDNEPFNPFGQYKLMMGQDYLTQTTLQIHEAFPESRILINSSGSTDTRIIGNFFQKLGKENPHLKSQFLFGYDYYYQIGEIPNLPLIDYVDSVALAETFIGQVLGMGLRLGSISGEVTEIQLEGWGRYTEPGNSVKHFRFALLRCLEKILSKERKPLVRIWGAEKLAKKAIQKETTDEHRQIIQHIQMINEAG